MERTYKAPVAARDNAERGIYAAKMWINKSVDSRARDFARLIMSDGMTYNDVFALAAYTKELQPARDASIAVKNTAEEPTPDELAWLMCGGTAAKMWAEKVVNKNERNEHTEDSDFDVAAEVCKVDNELGLVIGYGIVCKNGDEPYYDLQGDHIPEDAMLEAACEFMQSARVAKEMHVGDGKGTIVFAWPMTTEIAKALGITVAKTGLLIGMKPDDPAMLAKFKSGEYTGFSIGGRRIVDEEV